MTFREKIEKLCEARGWNQAQLARKVDVSPTAIGRWFNKDARPFDEAAVRLARALRVSLDYLADDTMDEIPAEPGSILSTDDAYVLRTVHALRLDGDEAVRRLCLTHLDLSQGEAPDGVRSNGSQRAS